MPASDRSGHRGRWSSPHRVFDPRLGKTRVYAGLHSTVTGSTVHVLGNSGLSLTLGNRLVFSSSALKASGKIVKGKYKFVL